ncbi:hypothetical protein Mpsy_3131 [Methanolobus psychrophilus R15]|nr:hypothetical protein Mpsy_3131 [Methanolobus psychrophilus R15]
MLLCQVLVDCSAGHLKMNRFGCIGCFLLIEVDIYSGSVCTKLAGTCGF